MADVRLTATNPADSSVVPVACNERGELKLEEIPDQSFDGNLDGNLTVSGSASFAGDVESDGVLRMKNNGGTTAVINGASGGANFAIGKLANPTSIGENGDIYCANNKIKLEADGRASFENTVIVDGPNSLAAALLVRSNYQTSTNTVVFLVRDNANQNVAWISGDGSATFAGNKAGFTKEGYLWCTTRRGDTVTLDVTSNGLASWVPYTPPTRLTELQDRWAEKDGILPVPHESSQDEPETPQ